MGSNAGKATDTETNNLAVDRSVTTGTGLSIMDSIIIDPSDTVMIETIKQHTASFEVLMSGGRASLDDVYTIAKDVLDLVDTQAVRMDDWAYEQLQTSLNFLEAQREAGKYVIDLTDDIQENSFNLASDALEGSSDTAIRALDLVAEIKTGSYKETILIVTTFVVIFGLGALLISKK